MGTTKIDGKWVFEYDDEIYNQLMDTNTVVDLRNHVNNNWPHGNLPPFGVSKLRKATLAAIVADWKTTARDAEEDAAEAVEATQQRPAILRQLCGCGQRITVHDNGTFKRHTRFNDQGDQWQGKPIRVRCESTGKFPQAIVDMRTQHNARVAHGREGAPYRSTQIGDAFRVGGVTGSRRARRVGTKNAHRLNYGKRFQTA